MSTAKLSSYFTKQRRAPREPEEGNGKPSKTVRARLEKKLHSRKKHFAFNFVFDGDEEDVPGGRIDERGSFRFGFTSAETKNITETVSSGRAAANTDIHHTWAAISLSGDGSRKPNSSKTRKKKKKGNSKKSKGGGKGKETKRGDDRRPTDSSECRTQGAISAIDPSEPHRELESQLPEECRHPGAIGAELAAVPLEVSERNSQPPAPLTRRPPPGLTLESWKDPALTDEERRRRRFGRGVRNMAAIQRSHHARLGGVADMAASTLDARSPEGGGMINVSTDGTSCGSKGRSGTTGDGDGGRSSVFAFGFDIGISFNGS